MYKKDSIHQLLLSIAFIILGTICFVPNVNFLQQLISFSGIIIIVIGLFIFIKGVSSEYDNHSRKVLLFSGLIIALIGISFSSLVWVLFEIFAVALSIIFILYSLFGIMFVFKDKYGLAKVRIMSAIKNILYLGVGILLLVDCFLHHMIIDYILGILLIIDGMIGIITYISSNKHYHSVIDVTEVEYDEMDENKIVISEEEQNE